MDNKKFSKKVLDLVKKIPYGRITTYKEIARKLDTKAYRAVGNALNKNKNIVVIPCHRVVKSNSYVGGFSKGKKMKMMLLKKEGIEIKGEKIINFSKALFRFK